MKILSFIAVPLQHRRGQFMLTHVPFSKCLLVFRALLNPPDVS